MKKTIVECDAGTTVKPREEADVITVVSCVSPVEGDGDPLVGAVELERPDRLVGAGRGLREDDGRLVSRAGARRVAKVAVVILQSAPIDSVTSYTPWGRTVVK